MQCPSCQADAPPPAKFCAECGTPLALRCPQCGAETQPAQKFCAECGAPLRSAPPAPAGTASTAPSVVSSPLPITTPAAAPPLAAERKQVTVLAGELIATRSDGSPIDPDVRHDLFQRFFDFAQTEIRRYEGTPHLLPTGVFLSVFGAPIAHEDHPRRAVLAALGLRAVLADGGGLALPTGVELALRLALAAGPVVIGGSFEMPVGEAIDSALALCKLAEAGMILTGEATARQIDAFVQLAPVPVAGSASVYNLVAALPAPLDRAALAARELSPFVGRERELAILEDLLAQAAEGRGQVVGIAGEPGAGKSRLLHELRQRCHDRRPAYLGGGCLAYTTGTPYRPFIEMIRRASHIGENDSPAMVEAKMRASLEAMGCEVASALPCFLALLGVQDGAQTLGHLEPQALQARTFAAMRAMILGASRRTLVVMEVEDLHWIDETSESFLTTLVEAIPAARVLLLLTYRAGYRPSWLGKSYATQIALGQLSRGDSQTLVGAILRRARLETGLAAGILEKAAGNPFFLEELAQSLLERGPEAGAAVPGSIQDLIAARIDRLPAEHKTLLQTASVLGRTFPFDLLSAIWNRPAPPLPLLEDLKRWEFLYEEPASENPSFAFKHTLTQEVAYQTLLSQRRQTLHTAAAHALEQLHAGRLEEVYDRLADHCSRAGDREKTVRYLRLLARGAAGTFAHAEAAKALREALAQTAHLPDGTRDRTAVEVLLQLAESLLPLARFPETLTLFLEHRQRLEPLEDPKLTGPYEFWLAHTYSYLGQQDEAAASAERAIAAAQTAGDEITEGKACYVLGRDGFWAGRFRLGIEKSLRAVVLLERGGEPWWQGQAYWVAGFNHWALGQLRPAFEALERARTIGEALDDPRLDPSWSLGYFHASLGDWRTGIEECQRAVERARDPLNTAVAEGFLGYAQLEHAGEDPQLLPAANQTLERAATSLRETGMQQISGWIAVFLAEAQLAADRLEEARGTAREALETTREARFSYGAGLAQRTLGRIALAAGGPEEAAVWLGQARELFVELEAAFELARVRLDLAALADRREDPETARTERETARALFTELAAPRWIERARP